MYQFPLFFLVYFFLMKHFFCPLVGFFLELLFVPVWLLAARMGIQVPCAPGAQRDMGPLSHCWQRCVRLVSSRRTGMVWGEPSVPNSSCRRVPAGFLLAGVRGEGAAYWICKQGAWICKSKGNALQAGWKSHPELVPVPVQEHTEQPSSAFVLSLAWLYMQQDSVSLNKS